MKGGRARRSLKLRAVATVGVVALVAACATRRVDSNTAIPAPAPDAQARRGTRAVEQLRRDLQAIFSDAAIDHAIWAVSVRSLKNHDVLYNANSFRMQVAASNQKLITAAAAAERLGWDYRYTTRIYAAGPIAENGTLDGDLIISSNGDPTINPRHPERWAAFDEWARQLAAKGVRLIGGQLIGDDNAFAEPGWGLGWSWDDIALGYGAPVERAAIQREPGRVADRTGTGRRVAARSSARFAARQRHHHRPRRYHGARRERTPASRSSGSPGQHRPHVRGQIASTPADRRVRRGAESRL